jgi:hypothetical protein
MVCSDGWIECHPGTAAWVQAVGAIVAIAAAFLVSHFQGRSVFELRRQDASSKVRGALAIVRCAYLALEELDKDLLMKLMKAAAVFVEARIRANCQHACDEVLAIGLDTLPSEHAVMAVIGVKSAIKRGYVFIHESRTQFYQNDLIPLKAFIAELKDACDSLEAESVRIESGAIHEDRHRAP